MSHYSHDERVVMTLDAGGTSFRFCAMRGGKPVTNCITLPSHADNLDKSLAIVGAGFNQVKALCPAAPVAISFAFPGPADYPNGIILDPPNFPAFRGGVALGPMLADQFGLPVFINNDGDLFTYGEAMEGLLPHVNSLLKKAGSPKRYKNLLGITLGTGLGSGIVHDGHLFRGDNSASAEIHLFRNKLHPETNAEEGASIRAVRRVYAEAAGVPLDSSPNPKEIFEIANGARPGNRSAAIESFRQFGEVTGDAIAQALTLLDGLVVIGGGLSGASPLFLPALISELNSSYKTPGATNLPRLAARAFNLGDSEQLREFVRGEPRELSVPGSSRTVRSDALPRLGVGISRLGTSEATAIGAYAFSLEKLDQSK